MASQTNPDPTRLVESKKVWTALITNLSYLPGLLTLDSSLKAQKSAYPLLALYTPSLPPNAHAALDARHIPKKLIQPLQPTHPKPYTHDPRFQDCWTKLAPFSLTEYTRVIQLDADMLILQNIDSLMDLPLDPPSLAGTGPRVFAAAHACVCNPLRKPHYPPTWIPASCAYTTQHGSPAAAQVQGAPPTAGLGMPNGGLQVVNPGAGVYELIVGRLAEAAATESYEFADQSLLGDLFAGRWVALPYVFNALKTLRWGGVHAEIWRDEEVRNLHFILSPKPWEEEEGAEGADETHRWWWRCDGERRRGERERGLVDGF